MEDKKEEEKVTVRHTINAEETFTLAKDVFDIRCFIKNVYNNRAVISRRLNILTLSVSMAFTLLYVAYILLTGLLNKLNLGTEIALFSLLGVYAVMFVALVTITLCARNASTKTFKKIKRVLAYFKLVVRLLSIAITIAALVFATMGDEYSAKYIAVDIVLIVVSIITMVIQLIPLLFGGLAKLARWLLSPVKIKYRFSAVALEWYEMVVTNAGDGSVKKVSSKYHDAIGVCLDNYLIPALGKKYVSLIKPTQILSVVEHAPEEDKLLVEGILKSLFTYATECGYVTFDPCKDLEFDGSIEEEEKQKPSLKSHLIGMGKKIGMSALNKFIDNSTKNN